MLYWENLDKIVFTRNQLVSCDELIILSSHIGPTMLGRLKELPIKSTVIYGMYGLDGIDKSMHKSFLDEQKACENTEILYSKTPIHSKCYVWKSNGKIVSALIGSADFSINGLTKSLKEILVDVTEDSFDELDKYLESIIANSQKCEAVSDISCSESQNKKAICAMPLYILEKGIPVVPAQSGINWGMAKLNGSHVNINDAYIRIGSELLEKYPNLFPKKQLTPSDGADIARSKHRHNDNIEILWDDGTSMCGLLEGSVPRTVDGKKELFPKQISTTPSKSILGKYLRQRLCIPEGKAITYEDLEAYGRTSIDVSMSSEGIYLFDFSPEKKESVNSKNVEVEKNYCIHNEKKIYEYDDFFEGQNVFHDQYGKGTIIRKKNNKITVVFADNRIKFNYPEECEAIVIV